MGIFVTVEGANGSGKTTFIRLLVDSLNSENLTILSTKEPTDTTLGTFVKNSESFIDGKSYALLIAADRCYHLDKTILPNLNNFDIVISDRYIESSLVLQVLDGVEIDYVWDINSKFEIPDISFVLKADSVNLQRRLSCREKLSRFELTAKRAKESEYYLKAIEYIREKKFNVIILENNTNEELEKNVAMAKELIIERLSYEEL